MTNVKKVEEVEEKEETVKSARGRKKEPVTLDEFKAAIENEKKKIAVLIKKREKKEKIYEEAKSTLKDKLTNLQIVDNDILRVENKIKNYNQEIFKLQYNDITSFVENNSLDINSVVSVLKAHTKDIKKIDTDIVDTADTAADSKQEDILTAADKKTEYKA